MVLYLPTRVLFVKVEGNINIPDRLIISEAEQCGIGFGASRRHVRSEKMKNALLSAIPQLQWAGVNTTGCVAIISVKERSETDQVKQDYGVNSIIAARDGVIRDIIVTRGNALCKTGQAVKQGQVLVSGYTDCGIFIKAEPAEAEIFAQTLRNLDVVSPHYFAKRTNEMGVTKRYSVRIGKNIINFCKDSGISDAEYVKMYKEKILTLPGGFQLPVALIIEQNVRYDYVQMPAPADDGTAWLTQKADKYLRNQMIAGSILDSNVFVEQLDDVYHLSGNYSCLESIGQVRGEENIQNDG
jgi:similar to stage IV sporulation protein